MEIDVMAAKKKPKAKQPDAHRSGFLVRIPEAYRAKLEELKTKTDRPYTAAVRRALDAYLKEHGIQPPDGVNLE